MHSLKASDVLIEWDSAGHGGSEFLVKTQSPSVDSFFSWLKSCFRWPSIWYLINCVQIRHMHNQKIFISSNSFVMIFDFNFPMTASLYKTMGLLGCFEQDKDRSGLQLVRVSVNTRKVSAGCSALVADTCC